MAWRPSKVMTSKSPETKSRQAVWAFSTVTRPVPFVADHRRARDDVDLGQHAVEQLDLEAQALVARVIERVSAPSASPSA